MSQLPTVDRLITLPRAVGMFTWFALLYLALSVANLPGDWGPSVCGAWGCGPPTQALAGCHLAWFVLLWPTTLVASTTNPSWLGLRQLVVRGGICLGILLLLATVAYQRFFWWPDVSEWHRQFFWQRCGFVIATTTDIPMVQLLCCGLLARFRSGVYEAVGTEPVAA